MDSKENIPEDKKYLGFPFRIHAFLLNGLIGFCLLCLLVWGKLAVLHEFNGTDSTSAQVFTPDSSSENSEEEYAHLPKRHIILTIQCIIFILLPMYFNMIFPFENYPKPQINSLRCSINSNTIEPIGILINKLETYNCCNVNEIDLKENNCGLFKGQGDDSVESLESQDTHSESVAGDSKKKNDSKEMGIEEKINFLKNFIKTEESRLANEVSFKNKLLNRTAYLMRELPKSLCKLLYLL